MGVGGVIVEVQHSLVYGWSSISKARGFLSQKKNEKKKRRKEKKRKDVPVK